MGCGNSKVDNSARKPAPAKARKGRAPMRDEDNDNDKNNNETDQNLKSKSRTSQARSQTSQSKSQTSQSKSQSNRKGQSNNRNQTNHTGNDVNDGEKKRVKVAVNEKGYKKRIRENLRNASAGHDIEQLEKNMEIFVNNKLENGGDYDEAKDRMEFLLVRKEIKDACKRNHPDVLNTAILKVERSPYKRQLAPLLERAYYLKQHQTELDTFRHDISNMDQPTVSEIRSYTHPPDGVHETMIATYLICGYPEEHLTDWSEIMALMGRYGKPSLIREIQEVDPKNIDKNTALRARHYLGQYTLEEVRSVSNGAAAFYVWSSQMVGKNDKKASSSGENKQLTNSRRASQQTTNNQTKPITPADSGQNAKHQKQQNNVAKQQSTNTKK